jgi:Synergist-CTERM protein sorting domain-containing protein
MAEGTSVRTNVRPQDIVVALQNMDPVSAEIEIPGEKGIPVLRLVRNPANPTDPTPVVSKDYLPTRVSRSRRVIALPEADRPHSTVLRPTAYIIKCDDATAARITYTGVRMERLAEPVTVPVEYYTVTSFDANVNFRGAYNVTVSQLSTGISAVEKGTKTMDFPKDTYVFFMDQYNSIHASLTVEPSGGRNFGNYWFNRAAHSKKGFLPVALNQDYPAYRYMGDASALKTYFAGDITMLPFITDTYIEWPLMLTKEQKAGYTNKVLGSKSELLEFSSFVVNKFAAEFRVYLKKTKKAGDWYAWNWVKGDAEKIFPANDGYAALIADNISSNNEVIVFCVSTLLPYPGDPADLSESGVTVESKLDKGNLTVTINNSGLSSGEQVKFFFVRSKNEFFETTKAVTSTGGTLFEAVFTAAELEALGIKEWAGYAIQYSAANGAVTGYSTFKSGGFTYNKYVNIPGVSGGSDNDGCNAGYAAFALLMLIPFAVRRRS